MIGPGKYDDICTDAREKAKAATALLIILGGIHGDGFSAQFEISSVADLAKIATVPAQLRDVANQIEQDVQKRLGPRA